MKANLTILEGNSGVPDVSASPVLSLPSQRHWAPRTGARRRTDPDLQGISRDERPSRPADAGWRVRLFKEGEYVANRHFRDEAYGSKEKSLAAAKKFRDDMAIEFSVRRRKGKSSFLAKIRVAAGISQTELAGWMHVSTPLIARWEQQGAPLSAVRLASALIAGIVKPSKEKPTPNLAEVRNLLGLKQEEMASKFERRYNAYGEWERGNRRMPGWVTVYVDAVAKGWDEKGINLPDEKQEVSPALVA